MAEQRRRGRLQLRDVGAGRGLLVLVAVLEGDDAITRYRTVMGATNPAEADEGTIRKAHALSIGENSVHGSDSSENAALEIAQWFSEAEIVG